jgi:tRNA-Thr(GGU) m(6)t(6)A37 methyltransferase TsaA
MIKMNRNLTSCSILATPTVGLLDTEILDCPPPAIRSIMLTKPAVRQGEAPWLIAAIVVSLSLGTTAYLYHQNKALRDKISATKSLSSDLYEVTATATADHKDPTATKREETPSLLSLEVDTSSFTMTAIGTIQSPFPQRAGCPRQGTLAPHVRSHLILHPSYSQQIVDGLMTYSHVWIIFAFHLNPRGKAKRQGSKSIFTGQKIKPPRAPTKMGVLATRAPHRPNPVGLSLCLLEGMVTLTVHGRKQVCLVLRGLDVVDGTPVYDVKPYVPWDRIDHVGGEPHGDLIERMKHLRVPPWVSADDELATVTWTETARQSLEDSIAVLEPLYTSAVDAVTAISEIVAQDPRAVHDGRGKASNDTFEFTFGQLRVSFRVQQDSAEIESIVVDNGDASASPGSYPHNLSQRRLAEIQAGTRKLHWANPAREGITDGLFELRDGSRYTS